MVPRDQRIPSQDYSSSPGCSGWVWLETGSRLMDILGRMSTRDQQAPSPSTGAGRKCDLRARMFDVRNLVPQFEVSFLYITHHASDWLVLFQIILLQYGSDYQSVFTRLYFLGLVFTFLSVSEWSVYSIEEEVF